MIRLRPLICWVFNFMEVWKKITGFDFYEVSTLGRVRSLKFGKEKILIGGKNRGGYKCFNIKDNNGKVHFKTVHRLVAIAFIENKEKYEFINHLNKDKNNNSVDNLEWCSIRENNTHMRLSMKRTSKYTGVHFDKARSKWYTIVTGKQIGRAHV